MTAMRGDDDADHAALPGRRIDAGRSRIARRIGARRRRADVNLVWDPPWDPQKMSDEAKLELGML
jgi:metal-sulfur cluster biosynthetic enzyme